MSKPDVSGDISDRVRVLRQVRGETVEQVLSAAVATLEAATPLQDLPDHEPASPSP